MKRVENPKPSGDWRQSARMMKYEREDQELQKGARRAPEYCLLSQLRTLETREEEHAECCDEFSLTE